MPPIAELDALDSAAFAQALAPLFEGAPSFAARLGLDRPFGSYGALLGRARVVALAMPEAEQIALLDAHPRIGAPPATVSPLSFREQGYDRETQAQASDSGDSAAGAKEEPAREQLGIELDRLNAAYESRFGFRFVIHVAGRSRAEIARVMEGLLSAERQDEKQRALDDVVNIAQDRLVRLRAAESAG